MAEFILEANERKVDKQSQLTEIRDNKRVPGIIYGFSQKPVVIDLDYMALLKVLKGAGTSSVVTVKVSGKSIKTIVRAYQQDPVSDKIIHIDFMAVDAKKPITTKVPLEFIGQSRAVREQGGQLNKKINTVNVRCLPADLPDKIQVDITVFADLGQKLLIRDLKVSDKVTITNDPNDPVVNVTVPKKIILQATTEAAKPEGEVVAGEAKPEGEVVASEGAAKPEAGKKAESKK
ncbi:MAG: hypothetical protein A2406_04275 [Candidatus Komeilibacteria bacterium RIFOXYC1_FULL_37_11]|uniref:Large ribosomal subunit protein bL25 n=1 Tax=Candidatus Komeilibacteria bacterium RIFOXYC1_FULL_37_11 TaxID=1798555 RepID=A0A1G2BX93_9BACT|nr:MAG: hypothetical protein A2406_04275 [Candidatus Komeilibacteria bacterium RIFOXYC1_FULL_37_11]OGY95803.1 MAG: hypothetical protein A2611_03450 [Candidatus Komeilibacteria bacterium RIFOXYD1_FULL_37_29]